MITVRLTLAGDYCRRGNYIEWRGNGKDHVYYRSYMPR